MRLKSSPTRSNRFDWHSDGCSGPWGIRAIYRNLFNKPCQQHDFGYRNFGRGLRLGRNEPTRAWIDGRFRTEMNRVCYDSFKRLVQRVNRRICLGQAGHVWNAVRHFGRSGFYG